MRLILVLKCHAAALVLRASPLNWALYALWKMIQKGRYEVI